MLSLKECKHVTGDQQQTPPKPCLSEKLSLIACSPTIFHSLQFSPPNFTNFEGQEETLKLDHSFEVISL